MKSLLIGQKARILKILSGDKSYRRKLLDFGLLPGTEFMLEGKAPLGDPVIVNVRGSSLSLRQHEASILQIEKVD